MTAAKTDKLTHVVYMTVVRVGLRRLVFAPDQVEFRPYGIATRQNKDARWDRMWPWHRVRKITVMPVVLERMERIHWEDPA